MRVRYGGGVLKTDVRPLSNERYKVLIKAPSSLSSTFVAVVVAVDLKY